MLSLIIRGLKITSICMLMLIIYKCQIKDRQQKPIPNFDSNFHYNHVLNSTSRISIQNDRFQDKPLFYGFRIRLRKLFEEEKIKNTWNILEISLKLKR